MSLKPILRIGHDDYLLSGQLTEEQILLLANTPLEVSKVAKHHPTDPERPSKWVLMTRPLPLDVELQPSEAIVTEDAWRSYNTKPSPRKRAPKKQPQKAGTPDKPKHASVTVMDQLCEIKRLKEAIMKPDYGWRSIYWNNNKLTKFGREQLEKLEAKEKCLLRKLPQSGISNLTTTQQPPEKQTA